MDADTRWLLRLAVGCLAAMVFSFALLDAPLAACVQVHDTHPAIWNQILALLEYAMGIEPWRWLGTTVLVAGTVISRAVPRWHGAAKKWLLVTLAHFIASNLMIWGKHFSGRLRPHEWHGGAQWLHHGGSFPSGHMTFVGSLALPIAILYPRTRNAVLALLAFVGCARIAVSAHWASDVFAGAALTALVTWVCADAVRRAPWPAQSPEPMLPPPPASP
jgi:membrane-associated phospholipid phosphatase